MIKKVIIRLLDILFAPFVIPASLLFKIVRKVGLHRFYLSGKLMTKIGVIPIINHYYDPFFSKKESQMSLNDERNLPGIDWNLEEQLSLLKSFNYTEEFEKFKDKSENELEFFFENPSFSSGDAEYWYNIIRRKKPKKIIEIGSGHSTKMARSAVQKNNEEDESYSCKHICIEPFEMPWLEKLGIEIIRKKVEDVPLDFFKSLQKDDILFIDSSHMIRPQGDVLFEYLEILPSLNKGVIVHIHDIFSPRNYREDWVLKEYRLWNEQYLLEAFLTNNNSWKIIGAVNYLKHNYFDEITEKCPRLVVEREPGSFYITKV